GTGAAWAFRSRTKAESDGAPGRTGRRSDCSPLRAVWTHSTLGGHRARIVGRVGDLGVGRSADLRRPPISRPADDNAAARVYRGPVRRAIPLLRRLRPGPLQLDCLLAGLLTITGEIEVWRGSGAVHERLATTLVVPAVAATLAVRRLYPTIAGVGAGVLTAVVVSFWGDPQVISDAVAYFCA